MRPKLSLQLCLLAAVLFTCPTGHAATYYVATNGDNANNGTDRPWKTVAYAVSRMEPGDTTYVRAGTYYEGIIRFSRSGKKDAPIKLVNAPGESPVIHFVDPARFHRILIQHALGYSKAIGWITIEGFEIRNGYEGLKYYNLHDSVISRNWIHHVSNQGILGYGARILIDRNTINHVGEFTRCAAHPQQPPPASAFCAHEHGIYASGSSYTITNNVFYDNIGFGIQQNGSSTSEYDPKKHAGLEFADAANWLIANNTFAYQYNQEQQ